MLLSLPGVLTLHVHGDASLLVGPHSCVLKERSQPGAQLRDAVLVQARVRQRQLLSSDGRVLWNCHALPVPSQPQTFNLEGRNMVVRRALHLPCSSQRLCNVQPILHWGGGGGGGGWHPCGG